MAFCNLTIVSALALTGLLSFLGYHFFRFSTVLWKELTRITHIRRSLPGDQPHWVFGNVLQEPGPLTPGFQWHHNMVEKYNRVFVFWVGWKPIVILNHPDSVRKVLNGEVGTVKSALYRLFDEWLGLNLATTDGAVWRRHRRLITNSFHFNVLKSYIPKMNRVADTLVSVITKKAEAGEPLPLYKTVSAFSSDVILQCAFSHESNCQEKESVYVKHVDDLPSIMTLRSMSPHLSYDFIFKRSSLYKKWREGIDVLHGLQEKLISDRRENHSKAGTVEFAKGMDFLDTLLLAKDAEGGLSDEEIRNEVNVFMFAGMDTTSSALNWFFYLLATHPEEQKKVQKEIDDLLEDRDVHEVHSDDLHKTSYMMQCIKESQRMYSLVSPGRLLTEPLIIEDMTIPAGTELTLYTYQLHHNPDVWGDDHMEFRPSRFEQGTFDDRDPFAFIPFSAGARNCIAQQFALQEIQIAAIRVLAKFSFSLVRDSVPIFRIISRPQDEILLGIHPRGAKECA